MQKLIAELRRRHVFRVAGTYVVVGWVLIQLGLALEETLHLPGWFDTFITVMVLIGFPIALVLSWAFEVTPEGMKLTEGQEPGGEDSSRKARVIDYVLVGALVVVGVLLVADWFRPGAKQEDGPVVAGPEAAPSGASPTTAARRTAVDQDPRIAVMPFINMSNDPANAFFADGISEEILNSLVRVKGVHVIARTSSFALRGTNITVPEIGDRLNADLVLEGSVRKAGNQVRITAQLIETMGGHHLWSEVYERTLDDLFGVQDEVSLEIARAIPNFIEAGAIDASALETQREIDPLAYRYYLEARFNMERSRAASNMGESEAMFLFGERAYDLIEKALELEPDFADAITVMGDLVRTARTRELRKQFQTSEEAVLAAEPYYDRALAIDPNAIEVLVAQAMIVGRYKWQWEEAGRLYERALEVNPNHAPAHTDYAYHLSKVGRAVEALYHAREGVRLNPTDRWRELAIPRIELSVYGMERTKAYYLNLFDAGEIDRWLLRDLFIALFLSRDVEGLEHVLETMKNAEPRYREVLLSRGFHFITLTERTIQAFKGDPAPFIEYLDHIAGAYDAAVETGANTDLYFDDLWIWSVYYAWVGETEKALHYYERAIRAEVLYLPQNFPYAEFEFPPPVRDHPRYRAIWDSRPELVALKRLRLEALQDRQMRGILPDGTLILPDLE